MASNRCMRKMHNVSISSKGWEKLAKALALIKLLYDKFKVI
jgi:hypothetical protein